MSMSPGVVMKVESLRKVKFQLFSVANEYSIIMMDNKHKGESKHDGANRIISLLMQLPC